MLCLQRLRIGSQSHGVKSKRVKVTVEGASRCAIDCINVHRLAKVNYLGNHFDSTSNASHRRMVAEPTIRHWLRDLFHHSYNGTGQRLSCWFAEANRPIHAGKCRRNYILADPVPELHTDREEFA